MLLFWKEKGDWGTAKISESRLVFLRDIKLESRALATKLEGDIEAVQAKLDRTLDLGERKKIEAELRQLEREKGELEDLAGAPLPSATAPVLFYGLENRISELDEASGREKEIAKRRALIRQKIGCLEALEVRRKAIKGEEDFREAELEIRSDDRLIQALASGDFDYLDIESLKTSDLRAFFDAPFLRELERVEEQMATDDRIHATLYPHREEDLIAADDEWFQFKKRIEAEIRALQEETGPLRASEQSEDRDRLEWIEGYIPHLERQLGGRSQVSHRALMQREKVKARPLMHHMSPPLLDKTRKYFLEARELKLEQMRQYLRKRYEALKAGYEKAQTRFSERDGETLGIIFREGESWFENLKTIEAVKDFNQRLDLAEKHLEGSNESLDEIEANRPKIETEIRVHFHDLKAQLKTFTPERLEALIAQAEKDPRIYGGHLETLRALQNPESDFWAQVNEFEGRLADLPQMDLAELQAAREELRTLERAICLDNDFGEKIDGALDPQRLQASQKARKAIESLKGVTSMAEIQKILNETIGNEHVRLVDHATFEGKYRPYTTTGHMVFYERGEEWAIIVDQDALSDESNVATLQKQLTHELLHLEFERNDELKAKWLETFTSNEDWPQIKAAYAEAFPGKKPAQYEGPEKTTYTVEDWKDEDILSELFAMQNALDTEAKPDPNTPFGRLQKLTLPVAGKLLGFDKEKIRGYDEDDVSSAMAEGGEGGGQKISDAARGSYENYKTDIEEYERNINEILDSKYIGYVPVMGELLRAMKAFNENTKSLNERFHKNGSNFLNQLIEDRNKNIKKDLQDIMKNLATVGGEIPNKTMNPFRKIWIKTSFLAIADIFQMVKDVGEYIKRRHERKKEDHAARLGMAVFGNTNLGREFQAREKKAEHTEVEEWKSRYEHLDAWKLYHIIDGMARSPDPSKDQLMAILKILASKGRINWRHKGLWKVLNKLQSAVHLTPGDPILLHNPPLLRQKLHTATGEIWKDYDFYTGLEKENEDSYESSKKKFNPSLDKIQDQLTDRMEQLLRMHNEGKNVLGSEYEAVLEYSIENGKSYQEAVLFYLMMGIIKGILSPDRGLALDKHLNKFPGTQWIYSKKPPLSQDDYKRYAEHYFKKSYETGKVGPDFKNFFATHVQNDVMTMQRVQKSVGERGWDHDWTRGIAMGFDANTTKRFLQGKSGQEEAKVTGVQNAVTGLLQWFEENAKAANRIDFRHHFAHRLSGAAMMDGIFNDVAYRQTTGSPYTRMNGSVGNGVSREAGVGNHGDWNTFKQFEKVQKFLDLFDQPLFTLLRDKISARTDPAVHGAKIITYLKEHYPEDTNKWNEFKKLDDIFDDMDTLIKIITSSRYVTDQKFLTNIAWLRQGIKEEE